MFKKIVMCGVLIAGLSATTAEAAKQPEFLIVEKVKGNTVLLVSEKNSRPYFINKSKLYKGVKVSDVFNKTKVKNEIKITFNKKETKERKKDIQDLMNDVFEK